MDKRKERLNAFLKWLSQKENQSNLDCQEFLFNNYGMTDKAIMETMQQLKRFGYLHVKGIYLIVNPKKKQLL